MPIGFILSDVRTSVESNWNDFMIPLGIDHRCVHCRLALRTRGRRKQLQQHSMKHWKPHMDEQGHPSMFHEAVTQSMAGRPMRNFNDFESVLVSAGRAGGICVKKGIKFKKSRELHTLRLDRRCARTIEDRKRLTFLIQLRHNKNSSLENVEGGYNFTMRNILETPSRHTNSIAPNSFATTGTKRICRHA